MKAQIIEKEGQFYKECGVVMLETTKVENSLKGYLDTSLLFKYQKEYKTISAEKGFTKHLHLYITSDDEINDGDWYYDITLEQIIKANINSDHNVYIGSCKKIIATTDKSLNIPDFPELENTAYRNLPQPSDKFIQAYIEAYNKGEKIEKVLVEVERYISSTDHSIKSKPKLKDNNIIIKKVKDKFEYNRSQLLKLVHDVGDYIENKNSTEFNIDKWIEENL